MYQICIGVLPLVGFANYIYNNNNNNNNNKRLHFFPSLLVLEVWV